MVWDGIDIFVYFELKFKLCFLIEIENYFIKIWKKILNLYVFRECNSNNEW